MAEENGLPVWLPTDLLPSLVACMHPQEAQRAGLCGWEGMLEAAAEELRGYKVRSWAFQGPAWVLSCDFSADGICVLVVSLG